MHFVSTRPYFVKLLKQQNTKEVFISVLMKVYMIWSVKNQTKQKHSALTNLRFPSSAASFWLTKFFFSDWSSSSLAWKMIKIMKLVRLFTCARICQCLADSTQDPMSFFCLFLKKQKQNKTRSMSMFTSFLAMMAPYKIVIWPFRPRGKHFSTTMKTLGRKQSFRSVLVKSSIHQKNKIVFKHIFYVVSCIVRQAKHLHVIVSSIRRRKVLTFHLRPALIHVKYRSLVLMLVIQRPH